MFSQVSVCPQGGCPSMHWAGGCLPGGRELSAQGCVANTLLGPEADTPPRTRGRHPPADTMGCGQQVGSMHPTGMHSCSVISLVENVLNLLIIVY